MTALATDPLAELAHTRATHFRLHYFGAALGVRNRVEKTAADLPFLAEYYSEVEAVGFSDVDAWAAALSSWEESAECRLPLRALCEAGELDATAVEILFTLGLVEEDARFELVFAALQGPDGYRPTTGLVSAWWPESRSSLRRLVELGLVVPLDRAAGRGVQSLGVAALQWEALRGDLHPQRAPWAHYRVPETLADPAELILPAEIDEAVANAPRVLDSGEVSCLIVRGPEAGGRRTLLGSIARALGRGVLEVRGLGAADDDRWCGLGALATLLDAVPVVVLEPAPNENIVVPPLDGWIGPVGIVLGKQGSVSGETLERSVTIEVDLPDLEARRRHWRVCLPRDAAVSLDDLASRYRMTGGNIRRTADLAQAEAALAGRAVPDSTDFRAAAAALHRRLLDSLASPVVTGGDWASLAVQEETMDELLLLERRCRVRDHLHELAGEKQAVGVRALFTGPSGTGKTLAASILASVLELGMYRLDLSTVVNKYLGETEKNLSAIFARAEEADVALLLDEGDSILTRRTAVQTSNDRWANLETNYLLQRLESFEGILIVTTNAGERIDSAFQRRIDVVVEFHTPEAQERWLIWQLHLPPGNTVDAAFLEEAAVRCALTGGQIRNAVLHAMLLSLGDDAPVSSEHLRAGVVREYRKAGQACPLRSTGGGHG